MGEGMRGSHKFVCVLCSPTRGALIRRSGGLKQSPRKKTIESLSCMYEQPCAGNMYQKVSRKIHEMVFCPSKPLSVKAFVLQGLQQHLCCPSCWVLLDAQAGLFVFSGQTGFVGKQEKQVKQRAPPRWVAQT